MRHDFTTRRRTILGALIFLLLADVALAAYSWQLSSPQISREESAREILRLKLLRKSIADAQKIKEETPATQKDCEKFENSLLPAGSGYSSLSSELGGLAKKSGVHLENVAFKPTAIPERGMTEVAMESTINGDYRSVIQFLNDLQRSANIYEIQSLTLANEKSNQGPANVIKVGLHLKTYFRTAA